MLGRVSSLEEAVQVQSAKIEEEWSKDGVHVLGESVMAEIQQEARNAIVPKGVLNIASKMLHVPSNSICFKQDPKLWVTTPGCNWVCGDSPFMIWMMLHPVIRFADAGSTLAELSRMSESK